MVMSALRCNPQSYIARMHTVIEVHAVCKLWALTYNRRLLYGKS